LWMRETEAAPLDTPERRAALEHRLGELVRTIGDEALRRYYGADLRARMAGAIGADTPQRSRKAFQARASARGGRWSPVAPPVRGYLDSALPPISESLSRTFHLTRGAFAPRDVEILTLVLNHPDLLEHHAEDLAHVEFAHPDLTRLRDALVALSADPPLDHESLKAAVDARGCGEIRRRVEALAEKAPYWYLRPEAANADAGLVLQQALALHRRARELHRDLKSAEIAFGSDASERNFARIRDLQGLVSAVEGTEATVEGFGILSGHKPPDI
jgi:DNA primase